MSKETSLSVLRADRRPWVAFMAVFCLAAFLLMFRLGERSLRNPDEGRYAEIAREVLQSGDWVKPTLYGVGYLRKPVLFYWLVAGSFKALGASEFSARLVPALFGLFGVAVVFFFCRRFFGSETAIFAAAMLATNFWYLQIARYLVIDMVFSFFVVGALLCYYLSYSPSPANGRWFAASSLLLGLAFMTKGFLALVLVVAPVGLYLLMTGSLVREFRPRRILVGAVLFFCVAAPWYIMMENREPGFIQYFLGHENFKRFVSREYEHQEPWFYYLVALPLTLLPWSLYLRPLRDAFSGMRREEKRDPRLFLVTAALTMLVFFSFSSSKLPTYIVPCVPLFLMVFAEGWRRWTVRAPRLGRGETVAVALAAIAGILTIIGGYWYVMQHTQKFPARLAGDLQILGGGMLAGAVLCLRSLKRGSSKRLFYALVFSMAVLSLLFTPVIESMNDAYTTKPFAESLKKHLTPTDEIYVYDYPGPFYDFAFYLERDVRMVGLEGEFKHFENREAAGASVSRGQFLDWLRQKKSLYCLIRKSDFQELEPALREGLQILRQDRRKVLFVSGRPGGSS